MTRRKFEVCGASVAIGDDYGDNECTMRCQLTAGHDGPHVEKFDLYGDSVTVTWEPMPVETPAS